MPRAAWTEWQGTCVLPAGGPWRRSPGPPGVDCLPLAVDRDISKGAMGLIRWATGMARGLWTVAVGLKITMRHMVAPAVTMHYPDEKWVMPESFRGLLKVDMDACIVCDLCMK